MTKAQKLRAVNARAAGPNPRPTKPLPEIPAYFKQDPQAKASWKEFEGKQWNWVKNLES